MQGWRKHLKVQESETPIPDLGIVSLPGTSCYSNSACLCALWTWPSCAHESHSWLPFLNQNLAGRSKSSDGIQMHTYFSPSKKWPGVCDPLSTTLTWNSSTPSPADMTSLNQNFHFLHPKWTKLPRRMAMEKMRLRDKCNLTSNKQNQNQAEIRAKELVFEKGI